MKLLVGSQQKLLVLTNRYLRLLQTVVLALSCLMATLLMTPSEAAPAPAPAPAPQALESLLLAKLLFLKGDVDSI